MWIRAGVGIVRLRGFGLSCESANTVKPVLMATCIQRPPVLRGHSVMSQRCLRNIFWPVFKDHL